MFRQAEQAIFFFLPFRVMYDNKLHEVRGWLEITRPAASVEAAAEREGAKLVLIVYLKGKWHEVELGGGGRRDGILICKRHM
jgi:hypothetical protein